MEEEKKQEIFEKARQIKLIIIGVDGVLTDAGMYFAPNGDMLRKFNRRDGTGLQLLKGRNIKSCILSSIESNITKKWAEMFMTDFIILGTNDKLHEVEKLQIRLGIEWDDIAYISDDIDEYEILIKVGFGVTVSDGINYNKDISTFITKSKGGEGAVREVIEIILQSQQ